MTIRRTFSLVPNWLYELLGLTNLSDVTAKTGTGTTVVMNASPSISDPTLTGTIGLPDDSVGADKIVLGSGSAALAASDSSHTASAWNSIGAGVSISITAGTWLVLSGGRVQAIGSAGIRRIRVQNTTDATTTAGTVQSIAANDEASLSTAPVIVTVAETKTLELQFFAVDSADVVQGGSDSPTAIAAIRLS